MHQFIPLSLTRHPPCQGGRGLTNRQSGTNFFLCPLVRGCPKGWGSIMTIKLSVLFAYIVGILVLFLLGRASLLPMKIIVKLLYNTIIGGIILLFINLIGGVFNYHIALNLFSALIVGFLGVPGVILLVILKYLFKV